MTPQELQELQDRQKWFDYISTLRPYLVDGKESPLIELSLILQTFINEAEQSINSIVNEAIKAQKRAKLSELYKAHNMAIQSAGVLALLKMKNKRQSIRLNEVESMLIELAAENKRLKEFNEF
ncbi:MAG: hypothetical protein EBS55_03090 [Flavobacteriaceae bacterium]|nr:hypothetical protein [Flavobacteriaceae bacterium]